MSLARRYDLTPLWRGMLSSIGLDSTAVLRHANLPEDLLHRSDLRVTADQFFALARALGELTDDPAFPVRLAESMRPEFFSPPLFAALCSPDVTVAVQRFALFKPLMYPVHMQVHHDAKGLHVGYRWAQAAVLPPEHISGTEALVLTRLLRIGTGAPICPSRVQVPCIPASPQTYEAFLGVPLEAGDGLRISFAPDDARRPMVTANDAMWDIFEPTLRRRLCDLEGGETFAERTRAVLIEALPTGRASIEQVAQRLAVSARTLQRRLRQEHTSFQQVVRDTREQLARHYLGRTHLTVAEIAYLVGFEDPSSFFRAFQGWTGTTPELLRRSLRRAD